MGSGFVPNSAQHHKALAADIEARDSGHSYGSPSYFDFLEDKLGLREKPVVQAPRPQPLPRNSYATMAPVTRESPSWTTGKTAPSRTEVSAEEADLARIIGISIEEYRLQKERLNNLKASGVIQQ
jgi:hypothetical protein